jgi:hypothetical protein
MRPSRRASSFHHCHAELHTPMCEDAERSDMLTLPS